MQFAIGQRWASNTEPQLGLGIITEVSGRRITVSFPAVEDVRTYAADTAPLSRIIYSTGDTIRNHEEQSFEIIEANELRGLMIYLCRDHEGNEIQLPELELNCFTQFTTPQQRLFSGQFDRNREYELRVQTLLHSDRLQKSPAKGLMGSRTSLLPHQVYIASEVAHRHAPRVLLADEVGLGKTIEAGMILHQQIHTGQVNRVLIVVPDSLVHQWLVEMLRRFNIKCAIFDHERFSSLIDSGHDNPFDTEQRIIASLDFFQQHPQAQTLAIQAGWDMVIVDEAHHLHWSPKQASPEYQFVEYLSLSSEGLLLLTATPEQVGIEGHFARLRLLDPSRFHDLEAFRKEEAGYQPVNELVQEILTAEQLDQTLVQKVMPYLPGEQLTPESGKETLIAKLLDHHGTGRVLFRNTRSAIKGFPKRVLNDYALDHPELYDGITGKLSLYPETLVEEEQWLKSDPRVAWLVEQLKSLKGKKTLVICHHADTALALDKYLNLKVGIRSASFYEGLTIIERDRAAAYFAEQDGGAQALICSEIGSEGRNFQFAHHLVLFDLPLNPDLLEQRIGRLDRIGQLHDIQIHVPHIENTAQSVLFDWYHQGIGLFTQSCAAGFAIFEHFEQRLTEQLEQPHDPTLAALINETAQFTATTLEQQQKGRDPLLELNSCRPDVANALIEQIQQEEDSQQLHSYMENVFDQFGLDHEDHSEAAMIIQPSDQMRIPHFPGLKDEGNTVTFSREKALSREDMDFLSWEHPMVFETMELIRTSEWGNANLASINIDALPPGTLLLETWFCVQMVAARKLQLDRFLSLNPTRFLLDVSGKNLDAVVAHDKLNELCEPIRKGTALKILPQVREPVEQMLAQAKTLAEQKLTEIRQHAITQMEEHLGGELARLKSLSKVNPNIRQDEIEFLQQQMFDSQLMIEKASLECQAVRVVINSGGK